jgi:hypothetical protein
MATRAPRRSRAERNAANASSEVERDLEAGIAEGKDNEGSETVDDKGSDGADEEQGLLPRSNAESKDTDAAAAGSSNTNKRNNKGGNNQSNKNNTDIENQNEQENNIQTGAMRVLEPIRTDPIKALIGRQKRLERLPAEGIPETHYVGQIISGCGLLEDTTEGASVRWRVDTGKSWQLLGGSVQGQTQVAYCKARDTESIPFNHPLDMHFAEAGLSGWGAARISFQCYRLDWTGRRILVGYGFEHLPTSPGHHKMEISLWRPTGTRGQELEAYLLGRTPALVNHEPIYDSAWRERCRLVTIPAGKIKMEITVLSRNTKKVGLDTRNV